MYGAAGLPCNNVPYLLDAYFQLTMPMHDTGMRMKVEKKAWANLALMDQMFWLISSPYNPSIEVLILRVDVFGDGSN